MTTIAKPVAAQPAPAWRVATPGDTGLTNREPGVQTLLSGPKGALGGGSIENQVTQLGDSRLPIRQRQALAAEIGRVQGNRQLQRVMVRLRENDGAQKYTLTPFSDPFSLSDTDKVQMNRELKAQAFTHQQDVFFGVDKHSLESSEGKRDSFLHLPIQLQMKQGKNIVVGSFVFTNEKLEIIHEGGPVLAAEDIEKFFRKPGNYQVKFRNVESGIEADIPDLGIKAKFSWISAEDKKYAEQGALIWLKITAPKGASKKPASRDASKKPALLQEELTKARDNFDAYNSHLGGKTDKIYNSITLVSRDNIKLLIEYLKYYSSHKIEVADSKTEARFKKEGKFGETKARGNTVIRPDILESSYPNNQLGVRLIHEFSHVGGSGFSGKIAIGVEATEGASYGIEYFFAVRTGDKARQEKILDLIWKKPEVIVIPTQIKNMQELFRIWFATMTVLYEVIDKGSSPRLGSPLVGLTADDARALSVELVAAPSLSQKLKDIKGWVTKNIDKLDLNFGKGTGL